MNKVTKENKRLFFYLKPLVKGNFNALYKQLLNVISFALLMVISRKLTG